MSTPAKPSIEQWWHPEYRRNHLLNWQKWRKCWESGEQFIVDYLQKFSIEESDTDFNTRKKITYIPAFAKMAIVEIKNAIFQRMTDVTRAGGDRTYQSAVRGTDGGVNRMSDTMTSFIGKYVLPELLVMARVGIYVDMPTLDPDLTAAETSALRPYIYTYACEDIINWEWEDDRFTAIMLRDVHVVRDSVTNLPTDTEEQYRHVWIDKADGRVHVKIYDKTLKVKEPERILDIEEIPFVLAQLPCSLMTDIASYQVSLLNLASADVNFAHRSNVPFYTEQYDPRGESSHLIAGNQAGGATATTPAGTPGTSAQANTASRNKVFIGSGKGRRYAKDTERPGFIHPSPEPLRVSMEKQKQMKEEIRLLVNLALSALKEKMQSAETKQMEQQDGLEAGLSAIGLELEKAERDIARFWAMYRSAQPATIFYPRNYSLKSDAERYEEAKLVAEQAKNIPSLAFQKEIKKDIARILISHKVTSITLEQIYKEIDGAKVVDVDPEIIRSDVEAGLLSAATGSEARGYPAEEVKKAQAEHAARLAVIAESQAKADAARGVADAGADPNAGSKEKEASKNTDGDESTKDKTRGEGK